MKSQDILVLLKLVSLHRVLRRLEQPAPSRALPMDWEGWEVTETEAWFADDAMEQAFVDRFTTRGLEAALGLSKSEVSKAITRSAELELAIKDRKTGYPKTNTATLLEFIRHGLKYVFPARPGPMVRGIPTAAAAPVLEGELASPGQFIHVWADPLGKEMGQQITPIYKSVPYAVRRDGDLYAMLALVDAIRLGKPREAAVAGKLLERALTVE